MSQANNETQKMANDKRNRTTKSKKIRALVEKETYKYLGKLEAGAIKQAEAKEKELRKQYLRRTRKLPEAKQYSRNPIKR